MPALNLPSLCAQITHSMTGIVPIARNCRRSATSVHPCSRPSDAPLWLRWLRLKQQSTLPAAQHHTPAEQAHAKQQCHLPWLHSMQSSRTRGLVRTCTAGVHSGNVT